jgi:hypothetical protein
MVSNLPEGGVVTVTGPPTGDGSSTGGASPEVVVIDSVPEYHSAPGAAEKMADVVEKDIVGHTLLCIVDWSKAKSQKHV